MMAFDIDWSLCSKLTNILTKTPILPPELESNLLMYVAGIYGFDSLHPIVRPVLSTDRIHAIGVDSILNIIMIVCNFIN